MKIGIDISQMQYAGTGVARYTKALVEHIVALKTANTYSLFYASFSNFFVAEELSEKFNQVKNIRVKSFPIPEFILHYLWNNKHMVSVERFIGKQDVFLYSDWLTPPCAGRKITTVHDLVFKKYPQTVHPYILQTQERRFKRLLEESFFVICDSYATQKDLLDFYPIKKENTTVIYPGVETEFRTKKELRAMREKLGLNKPYILTVGKKEPRKNIPRLIEAFKALRVKDLELVIVGPTGWENVEAAEGIRVIPYVSDKTLYALYQEALFFIMSSLYEGFGFPLLEAMSLGCPTTCSQTSSLAEIGKDASLFFDPQHTESICEALRKMTKDEKLRTTLISEGKKKAATFSWQKTAKEVLAVFEKQS